MSLHETAHSCWGRARAVLPRSNRFPLILNDLPSPLISNNPGPEKLFCIRGAYLLKELDKAAFKFRLNSMENEKFIQVITEIKE